ncbi:mRNA splicing factor, Cwf18 [Metarhizium album ARSEF 1941]|uniref:mRNA splicing factor, Cwf18 n=1 Tax=Metarhizium album (strain ARSEF 1941) TaxID=1081103 RepID=A0A0B2WU05_METAS|nr:mRNA splicing factor, Cwf18 [Metarhizium album ARSEF 1941]KHN96947.1 mRNA splicing factor, Cwf18 [Metarhizium album ARSEF 1941]
MSSSQHSLSAASEDRKSRLAALRNLKRKKPDDNDEGATGETKIPPSVTPDADVSRLHLSGRNYDPETKGPKLGFDQAPNEGLDKPTLEEQAADVEAQVKQHATEEAQNDKGLDLFKLQPKKPNWDLKRNLEAKMDILTVRTDNAIARLVRERISGAQKAATDAAALGSAKVDGDAVGMDGVALVEGLRVREQEEEEEERRERAENEALLA